MIPLKRKEFYSGSLPRCQVTPTMEQQFNQLAVDSEMGKSEIHRRALDLFLSLVCQNWQTEYPETRQLLDAYTESVKPQGEQVTTQPPIS
jgi:hypothetical protein